MRECHESLGCWSLRNNGQINFVGQSGLTRFFHISHSTHHVLPGTPCWKAETSREQGEPKGESCPLSVLHQLLLSIHSIGSAYNNAPIPFLDNWRGINLKQAQHKSIRVGNWNCWRDHIVCDSVWPQSDHNPDWQTSNQWVAYPYRLSLYIRAAVQPTCSRGHVFHPRKAAWSSSTCNSESFTGLFQPFLLHCLDSDT